MHAHRIHLPEVHLPRVHLPHPDLRHLARDVAIAAEVALASVVLTGSIEAASHLSLRPDASETGTGDRVVATQVVPVPAPAPATVRIDVETGAAGPVARVRVPDRGSVTLRVLDASGATVVEPAAQDTTVALAAGSYRVLVSHVGPVETVGASTIASSTVVRSDVLTVADGDRLTVDIVSG